MAKPAVIVISSHVIRGSVGGRAAAFVLERMGFPVWAVPTVVLPWHPGQGRSTRVALDPAAFAGAVSDLAGSPHLDEVGAILTGYFGDAGQIEPTAELVALVKARNPEAIYLCDPVIGDADGLFRPESVAAAIRDRLLPLADIATPNRHELMWLAGARANSDADLVRSARAFRVPQIIVTSAFAPVGEIGTLLVGRDEVVFATHAELGDAPHGTGDVFAALMLGHLLDGVTMVAAMERAASATLRLVQLAAEAGADELPLAAGQAAFAAPASHVTLTRVDL